MHLTTERDGSVVIVRVGETRLIYPLLSEFAETVTALIKNAEYKILIDLSQVIYLDSASIGCLMDLYRQSVTSGGTLKLSGVHKRVRTMLTMTGAQEFIEIHGDERSALDTCGVGHAQHHDDKRHCDTSRRRSPSRP